MSMDLNEINATRELNRDDCTGQFGASSFSQAEISNFAAAPSAEVRAQSSRQELAAVASDFDTEFDLLVNDFDREHHGDPDGARVAALADAEGLVASSTPAGSDGPTSYFDVVLARTDAHGDTHSMMTPFTMSDGEKPTTALVLNALLSDSAALNDVDDVADWANQFGYDLVEEGPVVRMKYQEVLAQDQTVRGFLGTQYDAYIWGE
jgi:hypothetical protein